MCTEQLEKQVQAIGQLLEQIADDNIFQLCVGHAGSKMYDPEGILHAVAEVDSDILLQAIIESYDCTANHEEPHSAEVEARELLSLDTTDPDKPDKVEKFLARFIEGYSIDEVIEILLDQKHISQATMHDYFEHVYDVEYRIGRTGALLGVRFLVAGGGPTIYVTDKGVEGIWGGGRYSYLLTYKTMGAINQYGEELYNINRSNFSC